MIILNIKPIKLFVIICFGTFKYRYDTEPNGNNIQMLIAFNEIIPCSMNGIKKKSDFEQQSSGVMIELFGFNFEITFGIHP